MRFAESLLEALRESRGPQATDAEPAEDSRPTPEQKALIERLARLVDARAAELGVSAEILAPRGELKALAMGERDVAGARRAGGATEIGETAAARPLG